MFPLETLIFELIVLAILNYIGPYLGRHFLKADALLSKIIFMVAQEFSPSSEIVKCVPFSGTILLSPHQHPSIVMHEVVRRQGVC